MGVPRRCAPQRQIGLPEGVEQPGLLIGGDADSGVGDFKAQQASTVSGLQHAAGQGDAALTRELECAAEIVDQSLQQPRPIFNAGIRRTLEVPSRETVQI